MSFPKGHFKHSLEWRKELSRSQNTWTGSELGTIAWWYTINEGKKLNLDELASLLGRTKQMVCRKARELGLTDSSRKTGRKSRRKHATDEEAKAAVVAATKARLAKDGHPRGMLGKKQSVAFSKQQSERNKKVAAEGKHPFQRPRTQADRNRSAQLMRERLTAGGNVYSTAKRGCRLDLGAIPFRSRWEANYARYLNLLLRQKTIVGWEFEPDTFWFETIKRGTRSYTPDFKITRPDGSTYYVEVKGWMDKKSQTKLKRMKKYHPSVEIVVLDAKQYASLEKQLGPIVPNWEGPKDNVTLYSKKEMDALLTKAS